MQQDSASSASSNSSSGSSSDDENSDNALQEKPHFDGYKTSTTRRSGETRLLLKEISRQYRLFDERFIDYKASIRFVSTLRSIMLSYKIRVSRAVKRDKHRIGMFAYMMGVRNLPGCLKEIRLLEDKYGNELWILQFLALHNMLVELHPHIAKVLFQSSIINVYMQCANAINKRQWHLIPKHVAGISFSFLNTHPYRWMHRITEGRRKYLHLNLKIRAEPTNFYLTSLFLASVQRHLHLSESPEVMLELVEATVRAFKGTCDSRLSVWSNPSGFFVTNEIIFELCHGFHEKINQIIESPLLQLEPDWQRAFLIYKSVSAYEVFCLSKSPQSGQILLEQINGNWANIVHKEHSLILLPIITELCVYLSEGEALFEKMIDCCSECPFMFTHVCRILTANGCDDASLALFVELIGINLVDLAPLDVTPGLLKDYSQDPEKHGPIADIVRNNLKLAFSVLDYGRNKNNLDAWQTLYANLKRVESDSTIISEFWNSRQSWWPRFHSLAERDECYRIKKKCFRRLNAAVV